MGLCYKIESRHFGFDKTNTNKFVATAVRSKTVSFKKVVEQISIRSGLSRAVCRAVVETMADAMCTWLLEGHGVSLGELGYLKPAITCKSAKVEGEEKITRKRVLFQPSKDLKQMIEGMTLDKLANDGAVSEEDSDRDGSEDTSHNHPAEEGETDSQHKGHEPGEEGEMV